MAILEYEFSSEPQWYVIVTPSNYEYKAKRDIIDGLMGHNFLDNVNEIFVPIKRFTIEYINSQNKIRHRIISKKILSLYVFINAIMTKELLWYLQNLSSIATVLASGGVISTVSNEEIENYKQLCIVEDNIYKGNKIINKEDPYINDIFILKKSLIKETKQEINIINNIYKNADYIHNKIIYEQNQKIKVYQSILIQKIYQDERFIKSKFIKPINNLLIEDRIDFNQINIETFKKLLNKYSLTRKFINLNTDLIEDINSYDLEKLKNLVIKYQSQQSLKKGKKKC